MSIIRWALREDVPGLIRFLGQAEQPHERVEDLYGQFMLLEQDGAIQAIIGYEQLHEAGLLRSLVLSSSVDQAKLLSFFQAFLYHLKEKGLHELYLMTDKKQSLPLFSLFGFQAVDQEDAERKIGALEHFQSLIQKEQIIILNCQLFTELSTEK